MRTDLKRRRLDVDVRVAQARTVSGGLKESIKALEPELLVLGSIRRARLGSVLTGDLAKRILDDARCPGAIVPNGYEAPLVQDDPAQALIAATADVDLMAHVAAQPSD